MAGIDERLLRVTYSAGHGLLSLHEPGAVRAAFHAHRPAAVPHWVRRVPFRQLFGWWAGDNGMCFLHASAVGVGDRCVLLAGESGSGKSTTALACAEQGMAFLGDDLCLLSFDPTPVAHAVYGVAKLEPDARSRFPGLARDVVSVDAGQTLVRPSTTLGRARIAAVLLPVVTGGGATRATPVEPRAALFAVAPSTMLEANGAEPAALGRITRLVREVPCLRLELGTDLDGVVSAVGRVLQGPP